MIKRLSCARRIKASQSHVAYWPTPFNGMVACQYGPRQPMPALVEWGALEYANVWR